MMPVLHTTMHNNNTSNSSNNINNNNNINDHIHSSINNNNIPGPPPNIPFWLLSAFYSLSASPIPSATEIHDGGRSVHQGRSHNPGRPLCIEDRQRIVRLYEEGNRVSHIARLIGVTHSCVSKIMSRYRRTGSVQPRSFRAVEMHESSQWQKAANSGIEEKEKCRRVIEESKVLPFSIDRILSLTSELEEEEEETTVEKKDFKRISISKENT